MVFVAPQDTITATAFVDPNSAHATLVEYYAKSCPHCVHLKPVWEAAKSQGVDGVDFVAKECYGDNWAPGKDLADCKAHGVDAFPTLKLFKAGDDQGSDVPPLMGGSNKERTNELLDYVSSQVNGGVKEQGLGYHPVAAAILTSCNRRTNYDFF